MNFVERWRSAKEQAIVQEAAGFAMGFFRSEGWDENLFERMELNSPTTDMLRVLGNPRHQWRGLPLETLHWDIPVRKATFVLGEPAETHVFRYGGMLVLEPKTHAPLFLDVGDTQTTARIRFLFLPFLPQTGQQVQEAQRQRRFPTVHYELDPQYQLIVHTILDPSDAMVTSYTYVLLGTIDQVAPENRTLYVWASKRPRRKNLAGRFPPGGGGGNPVNRRGLVPQEALIFP